MQLGRPPAGALVVTGDGLAASPSETKLDADDDEQDAEGQQRPVADRGSGELEDGQVDEDRRPQRSEQQADAAEEVQGAGVGSGP